MRPWGAQLPAPVPLRVASWSHRARGIHELLELLAPIERVETLDHLLACALCTRCQLIILGLHRLATVRLVSVIVPEEQIMIFPRLAVPASGVYLEACEYLPPTPPTRLSTSQTIPRPTEWLVIHAPSERGFWSGKRWVRELPLAQLFANSSAPLPSSRLGDAAYIRLAEAQLRFDECRGTRRSRRKRRHRRRVNRGSKMRWSGHD